MTYGYFPAEKWTMVWREPQAQDCRPVVLRSIPLVLRKQIPRKEEVEFIHIAIPGHLGDDRSRRHGKDLPVPPNNGDLRSENSWNPVPAVHRQKKRRIFGQVRRNQAVRPAHGKKCRTSDILTVDLVDGRPPQGNMKGFLADQAGKKSSFCRRKRLRIRDSCLGKTGDRRSKNNTGGNDRTGKSPPPDLVDACHKAGCPVLP